jgi:spermidine/putrescine transport system substrate-binding protein
MNMRKQFFHSLIVLIPALSGLLAGCGAASIPPTPTQPALSDEVIFLDWEGDMPQSVLDAFEAEYGVKVNYVAYEGQEDVVENIRTGTAYDVVVLDNRFIGQLIREDLLAEINLANVPNQKNISANFRNMVYDPDGKYTIAYQWGTTGLLVCNDRIGRPVTRWADLWEAEPYGKVGLWRGERRELLGVGLKALGYSVNSEDPAELEAALEYLQELMPNVLFIEDYDLSTSIYTLNDGIVVMSMGWAYDAVLAREINPDIAYILPEEGGMTWSDNFVIPKASTHQYTAEVFIDFLMRPEVNAEIVNFNYFATANEAAFPYIDPEILNDPVIFPPNEVIKSTEIILPLSAEGEVLYNDIWERFISGAQ